MNTPETDAFLRALRGIQACPVVHADKMREFEKQRNEARREARECREAMGSKRKFSWEEPKP